MLISTKHIPSTLWETLPHAPTGNVEVLRLPRLLVKVYQELLDDLALAEEARKHIPNDEGPQGGITKKETLRHFCRNFSGSCARLQLVMLDPKEVFETTRDLFVHLFAGGRLHLLDIPCGAGAACATMLCLAAELRRLGILPRHPLLVTVVGGDISAPARQLKRQLYRKLSPRLLDYGIRVSVSMRHWDIEDENETSELITHWVQSRHKLSAAAVFALNFSGFLSQKVNGTKSQLKEILRFAGIQRAPVIWVEPKTNAALTQLYPLLVRHVFSKVSRLELQWGETPRKQECKVVHPVQHDSQFTVRSAAMHLEPAPEDE